jgi:hypothetical protein
MTRAKQLRDRIVFIQKQKGKTDEEAIRFALDYITAFLDSYALSNTVLIKALESRIALIDHNMSREDKKRFIFHTSK